MKRDENICMTTVPIGEKRTLFVPLDNESKLCTALGFFVKEVGVPFTGDITVEDVVKHVNDTTPIVAFNFKSKKSITDLIKFLRFYRDNFYKKDFSNVNNSQLK